jgi:hypothetical protein
MVTRAPLVYARVTAASVARGRWWRTHGGDRTGQAQGSKAMKRVWWGVSGAVDRVGGQRRPRAQSLVRMVKRGGLSLS